MTIGKAVYHLNNVLVRTAVRSAQMMHVIYSAKWKGKTSFKRLLNMKGEQNGLLFLNVGLEPDSSENRKKFRAIQNELKKHGIMYAVMPDLCGGDNNTQICVSAVDAKKVEAMLHSHMHGKYRDVYIAEISEYDYTMTGRKIDGSLTAQMQELIDSADLKRQIDSGKTNKESVVHIPDKNAAQIITAHDLTHQMGSDSYTWLKTRPLVSKEIDGKLYHLITMPDGKSGIIVPDREYRQPGGNYGLATGDTYGALVCEHKEYYSVNYKSGKVSRISGEKAVKAARKTPVEEYASRVERLLLNQKQKMKLGETMERTAKSRII